jgi:RNA polymerase sigma factor (TIGR02999 family)
MRADILPAGAPRDAMTLQTRHDVTQLLQAWSHGRPEALQKLMPLVYDELHRLAQHYMRRERPGHILQTSALINEAYIRLIDASQVSWQNRAHFFAISAELMRRILVDWARAQTSQKRGAGVPAISLDEDAGVFQERLDLAALDDALQALARLDPRKSRVVELRFFGGLSVEDTAEALGVSPETVKRDWKLAKIWLLRELTEKHHEG